MKIRHSNYTRHGIIPGTAMLWKMIGESAENDQNVSIYLLPVLGRYVGGVGGDPEV